MIPTAAILTTAVLMGILFWAMDAFLFLRPYKAHILMHYGRFLAFYIALLMVNVFAASLQISRKLGLRRAGQRLRQLQREGTLADELAHQIEE